MLEILKMLEEKALAPKEQGETREIRATRATEDAPELERQGITAAIRRCGLRRQEAAEEGRGAATCPLRRFARHKAGVAPPPPQERCRKTMPRVWELR
jgi:hypothetical protein